MKICQQANSRVAQILIKVIQYVLVMEGAVGITGLVIRRPNATMIAVMSCLGVVVGLGISGLIMAHVAGVDRSVE